MQSSKCCVEPETLYLTITVKSFCLTKHHAMKTYFLLN